MICARCHKPTERRSGNQKYCSRCYHTKNSIEKIAAAREKRGQQPDNGKPYQKWVWEYIRYGGRWEPRPIDWGN